MFKSKKIVRGILAVTAILLVVIVLGVTTMVKKSGLRVKVVAKGVNALIQAEYKINDNDYQVIKTEDNQDAVVFNKMDDSRVAKYFKSISIDEMKRNDVIIIHYTIINTDTEGVTFNVMSASAFTESSNLTIQYSSSETPTDWEDSITNVANSTSVAAGDSLNMYVKISITKKTINANLQGAISFNLTVNN